MSNSKYNEKLPASFEKKYKNTKMKEMLASPEMWLSRPLPTTPEGRSILRRNEKLFDYCETLEDVEFAFEPVENVLVEMVPGNVRRQGAGISVDQERNELELDVYFFPCDFSEDEDRNLPYMYVRVPVVSVSHDSLIDRYVRQYFIETRDKESSAEHMATIPFSIDRTAILYGNFMDDYKKTARICRALVKNGTEMERKRCEAFLEFVRTAGF